APDARRLPGRLRLHDGALLVLLRARPRAGRRAARVGHLWSRPQRRGADGARHRLRRPTLRRSGVPARARLARVEQRLQRPGVAAGRDARLPSGRPVVRRDLPQQPGAAAGDANDRRRVRVHGARRRPPARARRGAPPVISVLYFSNTLVRGGAEEHILTLLRGLDRQRFRPSLVCTPEVAEKIRGDVPHDVELIGLRLRKPYEAGADRALFSIMHERRPDIVHSHLFDSSRFASPIATLSRVPLVVETPHLRESWRRGLKARFVVDRIAGRFVDQYIAVSEANRRYLVEEKA